jgi:diguanylate cyclase (GGDEF)-like protein
MSAALPDEIEILRLRVLDRLAALLESQTRSKFFSQGVFELIHNVHQEVKETLLAAMQRADDTARAEMMVEAQNLCTRLDDCLQWLFHERNRQWSKNGEYVRRLITEFNDTLSRLSTTLIEKDLLERQSEVLERIILSHENISHWKEFVRHILIDFHEIFPFNFFFIAFREEHSLSLHLYYLGQYSPEAREAAQHKLVHQMLHNLQLPVDAPMDIEEFLIDREDVLNSIEAIELLTVSIPDHKLNLAGLLGVAYASERNLTPQEQTVIRSILSVMVMVVGSSKVLSRTLAELEYYAAHDPLTGLYNRRYFNALLQYELGRSERHHHEFSILMLDLDDFKDVNDSYGHPVGDEALREVARILQEHTRKGDLSARLGGDEFAVILMETGRYGATTVAEILGKALRETSLQSTDGKRYHLTVSIGIVTFPFDANNETDLLAGVDVAMYRAKQMGKDSACTLDAVDEAVKITRATRDYAEQLREALQQNRMIPYFQPIVDCQSGEIFAYETLARLRLDNGDTVSAGVFIEAIEKYGMGRDLDRSIIRQGLEARKACMNRDADSKLFINLSSQEIQERNILGFAESLCEELEVPPDRIVFEILERDAIGDMTNMRKFLNDLGKKGFAFALDDFGSGYNSFHYLRELRFDYVKIDGVFVRNILSSKVDRALVRNLSRLCQDIGIRTVAEFVEDEKILLMLREMGVDYAQGYHIGMPRSQLQAS